MARRGLGAIALPGRGRLLSAPEPPPLPEPAALSSPGPLPSVGGKVLDASALDAWASGHLGIATWYSLAWELGLTFLVPAVARDEALLLRPDAAAEVDLLLAAPFIVLARDPGPAATELLDRARTAAVYDPSSTWIVALCHARGWPALSADPTRLRRLDDALEIDAL